MIHICCLLRRVFADTVFEQPDKGASLHPTIFTSFVDKLLHFVHSIHSRYDWSRKPCTYTFAACLFSSLVVFAFYEFVIKV